MQYYLNIIKSRLIKGKVNLKGREKSVRVNDYNYGDSGNLTYINKLLRYNLIRLLLYLLNLNKYFKRHLLVKLLIYRILKRFNKIKLKYIRRN